VPREQAVRDRRRAEVAVHDRPAPALLRAEGQVADEDRVEDARLLALAVHPAAAELGLVPDERAAQEGRVAEVVADPAADGEAPARGPVPEEGAVAHGDV